MNQSTNILQYLLFIKSLPGTIGKMKESKREFLPLHPQEAENWLRRHRQKTYTQRDLSDECMVLKIKDIDSPL